MKNTTVVKRNTNITKMIIFNLKCINPAFLTSAEFNVSQRAACVDQHKHTLCLSVGRSTALTLTLTKAETPVP